MSDFDRKADRAVGFEDADWVLPSHEAPPVMTPTLLKALDALSQPRHPQANTNGSSNGTGGATPPTGS
jgi:hypothetical protein